MTVASGTGARKARRVIFTVVGMVVWLAASGPAVAAESDLYSGLAYLRAGAQGQAEQHLMKYRDGELESDVRVCIDRVLPLLKRPLSQDLREYIASSVEDVVTRAKAASRSGRALPGYAARMFPVFP